MKVVLNSDILFHPTLVTSQLSRSLLTLFKACADKGHVIVIPLTSKLEFDKVQSDHAAGEVRQIDKAYRTLDWYGIQHEVVPSDERVKVPDLMQLIRDSGVSAILEDPTEDDLREAHRRACLHEDPHPPEGKSDEMRDLVIWMTALRISKAEDGALLISEDKVHTHARGDTEALASGPVRVDSVEKTLEYFEVETPAGQLVKKWLSLAWEPLRAAGLPLTETISLLHVRDARFVQGEQGPVAGEGHIRARTSDGKQLDAFAKMKLADGTLESVTFTDIAGNGNPMEPVTIRLSVPAETEAEGFAERLEALKEVLGEGP